MKYLHIILSIIFGVSIGVLSFFLILKQAATGDPGALGGAFIGTPILTILGGIVGYIVGLIIQGRKEKKRARTIFKQIGKILLTLIVVYMFLVLASALVSYRE